jgi:hypothetical protein
MIHVGGWEKDRVTKFFASGFFYESVSPQPQSIPLGPEIFANQGAPSVLTTTPEAILPLVPTTLVANLPLVSTTPAANLATSWASVVDIGGKFTTGVNDTGGN